ncbi:MAG: hypothetical protein ACRD63_16470 [Pyrinomonadaceae bacterium]
MRGAKGRYQIQAHSGDIGFSIPSDSSFHLEATLGNGSFDSSFKMNVVEDTNRGTGANNYYHSDLSRRIVGVVGSGNSTLELKTFNGSVKLNSSGKSGNPR